MTEKLERFEFVPCPGGGSLKTDKYGDWVRFNDVEKLLAKEGPLNTERWTLDELLTELEKWKRVASGRTCVSFENLCYGASSLWHQSHRENFRKVDRKPEALSRWILQHCGSVRQDFPEQVLEVLTQLKKPMLYRVAECECGGPILECGKCETCGK